MCMCVAVFVTVSLDSVTLFDSPTLPSSSSTHSTLFLTTVVYSGARCSWHWASTPGGCTRRISNNPFWKSPQTSSGERASATSASAMLQVGRRNRIPGDAIILPSSLCLCLTRADADVPTPVPPLGSSLRASPLVRVKVKMTVRPPHARVFGDCIRRFDREFGFREHEWSCSHLSHAVRLFARVQCTCSVFRHV